MRDRQQRLEEIRRLAAEGLTAAQIAGQMGEAETRSSVLGMCNRHGIALDRSQGQHNRATSTPADGRAADDPAAASDVEEQDEPASAAPVVSIGPLTKRPAPPPARLEGCRWPLWGDREAPTHEYCGEERAAAGKPYCAAHTERARGKGPWRAGEDSEA